MALYGDMVIIGSPIDDDMGIASGSVYFLSYRSVKHGRRYRNLPLQMRSLMIGLDVVFAKSGYTAVIMAVYDDERGNDIGYGYVYTKVD